MPIPFFAFFDRSWFFKSKTLQPDCSPHTNNNSGAIRVGLGARTKEKWGAGRTLFESAFYSAQSAIRKKALELFGSAPNIYFLSRAPRPTRMVSWLFVWGGQLGCSVLPLKYTFPEGKRMVSGKATALFYGFFEETCITLCVLQIHIGCHIQEYRAQ